MSNGPCTPSSCPQQSTATTITPEEVLLVHQSQQSTHDTCQNLFGHYANLAHTILTNYHAFLQSSCPAALSNKPTNQKVHNLCTDPTQIPHTLFDTLRLGLGFCLCLNRESTHPIDFDRLPRDIHTRYTVKGATTPNSMSTMKNGRPKMLPLKSKL
jgi:hypothetical protein